uniref:Polysaccharide biosynthesis protein n=1 Tax=Cyanothece sp. (strain PCC 7425 / ATCC 29141) TaxID=395961 RepID=B8HUJ1_CYAP4
MKFHSVWKTIFLKCVELVKSDFIQKVLSTLTTRVLIIIIGLLISVILSRVLGPDGRGLLVSATTLSAIGVQFGNLGLHASNTYYVAKDRSLLSALISNSLLVCFGFGGLGAFVLWIIFSNYPNLAPVQSLLLILALIQIPFSLLYLLLQNLLLGIHKVREYNLSELFTSLLSILLTILLVALSTLTPESAFILNLFCTLIPSMWILLILSKNIYAFRSPSIPLLKESAWYGFKAYLAALFSFLVLKFDILMIQHFKGAEQVGIYSIAITLVDKIYILPAAFGSILFPKLSSLSNKDEKLNFLGKTLFPLIVAMVFAGLLLGFLAHPIIRLLYGEDFLPAVPVLIALLPGVICLGINSVLMNYFASIGMPPITVYSPLIATIINVIINTFLIPHFGIIGAALSSTISYSIMLVLSLAYLKIKFIKGCP